MRSWLRRIRAMLGTGVLWGTASFLVGAAASPLLAGLAGVSVSLAVVLESGLQFATFGLFAGTGFAGILSAVERKKTVHELSVPRTAVLGGIAGATFPAVLALFGSPTGIAVVIISALLAAGLSAGTIRIAQHGRAEGSPSLEEPAAHHQLPK